MGNGRGVVVVGVVVVVALLQLRWAGALRFDLSKKEPKCMSEDIHSQVLVLADYRVISSDAAHPTLSVKVTSPFGSTLHDAEAVDSGQFGFTSVESGIYTACFSVPEGENSPILHVELDWKIGVAAKDWELVAKKDKIEGVELELTKLQVGVEGIRQMLLYMRNREEEMRNVNEYTNSRIAWFGVTSMFVCLAVGAWQLWYLRSFFEKNKLL